jgi:hypothetical protein
MVAAGDAGMVPEFVRASTRLRTAKEILSHLRLLERWSVFGTPQVVGAVAYDLVVAPDIDLECFCQTPLIDHGFEILRRCAAYPQIRSARFINALDTADCGLYWQLRYQHASGEEWKVDMWALPHNHPGPCASALVEPMLKVLTSETRLAILKLKTHVAQNEPTLCRSVDIYRAVIEGGIRTLSELVTWLGVHQPGGLIKWSPSMPG